MLLKIEKKNYQSNLQLYLQWESHSCSLGKHQAPTIALCLNDQIPGPDLQRKIYGTSTINPQLEFLTVSPVILPVTQVYISESQGQGQR